MAARDEGGRAFAVAVYRLVRAIPHGRVTTYGALARRLGRPRGARTVGQALRRCPEDLPWHRVVNAEGGISRRTRTSSMLTQRMRLEGEGVRLRRGRVPLPRYGWALAAPRAHAKRREASCDSR